MLTLSSVMLSATGQAVDPWRPPAVAPHRNPAQPADVARSVARQRELAKNVGEAAARMRRAVPDVAAAIAFRSVKTNATRTRLFPRTEPPLTRQNVPDAEAAMRKALEPAKGLALCDRHKFGAAQASQDKVFFQRSLVCAALGAAPLGLDATSALAR